MRWPCIATRPSHIAARIRLITGTTWRMPARPKPTLNSGRRERSEPESGAGSRGGAARAGVEAEALRALAGEPRSDASAGARSAAPAPPAASIVTGMGKSGHVARKIAATLASTGTPAQFVHPAEASHGDLGMIDRERCGAGAVQFRRDAGAGRHHRLCARFGIPLIGDHRRRATARWPGRRRDADPAAVDRGLPAGPGADHLDHHDAGAGRCAGGGAAGAARLHAGRISTCCIRAASSASSLLRVADLMHGGDELPLCRRDASMTEALLVMTAKRFGCVGVVDAAAAWSASSPTAICGATCRRRLVAAGRRDHDAQAAHHRAGRAGRRGAGAMNGHEAHHHAVRGRGRQAGRHRAPARSACAPAWPRPEAARISPKARPAIACSRDAARSAGCAGAVRAAGLRRRTGVVIGCLARCCSAPCFARSSVPVAPTGPASAWTTRASPARTVATGCSTSPPKPPQKRDRRSRSDAPKADLTTGGQLDVAVGANRQVRPEKQWLDLNGKVELSDDDGYQVTPTAAIDLRPAYASGDAPVEGHGPAGHVDSQGFRVPITAAPSISPARPIWRCTDADNCADPQSNGAEAP